MKTIGKSAKYSGLRAELKPKTDKSEKIEK